MTDQEHDVEDLIAALRDDLPSRDDERRVCARLATAGIVVGSVATLAEIGSAAASAGVTGSNSVAVGGVAAAGGAAVAGGAAAAGGTALGTSGSLSMAAGSLAGQGSVAAQGGALAVAFAKVAALGGGTKAALVTALAVGAGYPAVTTLLPAAEPVVASVPAAAARAPEPRAARTAEGQPASEREPRLEQPPVPEVAAETSRVEARTPKTPAVARSRAAAPAAPQTSEGAAVSPHAVVRTSALQAETALIERALRAVRAGDRDGALAWLSEHQRRYPNGALAPERQRALEQLQH